MSLVGERVSLRPISPEHEDAFIAQAQESVEMHRGFIWAPTTSAEFRDYLARFDGVNGVGFVVLVNGSEEMAGLVTILRIERGPYQRGVLGYGGFKATAGHGYVADGVLLAVRYGFEELGLRRLEADIQPSNLPSRRVVERAGFRLEGFSPQYIHVGGEWRDHERWAITVGAVDGHG